MTTPEIELGLAEYEAEKHSNPGHWGNTEPGEEGHTALEIFQDGSYAICDSTQTDDGHTVHASSSVYHTGGISGAQCGYMRSLAFFALVLTAITACAAPAVPAVALGATSTTTPVATMIGAEVLASATAAVGAIAAVEATVADRAESTSTCEEHIAMCRASAAPTTIGDTTEICETCYDICRELRSLRSRMFGVQCEPWPGFCNILDVPIDINTMTPTGESSWNDVSCQYWSWSD